MSIAAKIMESDNYLTNNNSPNSSVIAKMRRLKIQEDLLIQAIKKNNPRESGGGDSNFIKMQLEFKKFLSTLKKDHFEIKQLFGDVKCATKSQDILKTLDIDDIKRDVLQLEEKIKSFKMVLQGDLTELQNLEKDLLKQLDGNSETIRTKKHAKVTKKTFSDIVPSPVKLLINSPFKCSEVQQFQDFISSNKFGGWNEFNHNIFERIWKKHFQINENYLEADTSYIEKESFFNEVFEKISGAKKKDVIGHMKWYTKYLHLKKCQQNALDAWKTKTKPKKECNNVIMFESSICGNDYRSSSAYCSTRKKDRKPINKWGQSSVEKLHYFSDNRVEYFTNMAEDEDKVIEVNDTKDRFKEIKSVRNGASDENKILSELRLTKPTRQWKNRCNSTSDLQSFNSNNVDNLEKLGIPSWRIVFSKENKIIS